MRDVAENVRTLLQQMPVAIALCASAALAQSALIDDPAGGSREVSAVPIAPADEAGIRPFDPTRNSENADSATAPRIRTFDAKRIGEGIDPLTAERIRSLDPERVSARDVREVLVHAPAPRIVLLQGSFAPVTMQPFADFLVAMGYPEERLRNPRDGMSSASSFGSSAVLAGMLGWYYEREGMMPMLIGHSQGGMLVVRTLHELAGTFAESVPVWDPLADEALPRSRIVDPYTGEERPVIGLKVSYAAAIATGKLPRVLLGQWAILPLLRKIPDTVVEFTGFMIEWDLIAGTFPWSERYEATGSASVRNVILPATYAHIDLPRTQHLAANEATRAWLNAYHPATGLTTVPAAAGADTSNLVHAADIWYGIRKHWCLEAQRVIGAGRPE